MLVITAIAGDSVGSGASGRISSSLRAASSPGVTRRKTNTCEAMKIRDPFLSAVGPTISLPSTCVPFVLPRSSIENASPACNTRVMRA